MPRHVHNSIVKKLFSIFFRELVVEFREAIDHSVYFVFLGQNGCSKVEYPTVHEHI